MKNHWIIGRRDAGYEIYDLAVKKLPIHNIQAAQELAYGIIQVIKDNRIQWINPQGILVDSFPTPKPSVLGFRCGVVQIAKRTVTQQPSGFYEIIRSGSNMSRSKLPKKKEQLLPTDKTIQGVQYLNGKTKHTYMPYESNANLLEVFSFPFNYYIFKNQQQDQLVQVTADTSTTLFEGKIIQTQGYFHPIKFEKEELCGYFPQNQQAKYKSLGDFYCFFAPFVLPDGKKGWLDIYGKEYYEMRN